MLFCINSFFPLGFALVSLTSWTFALYSQWPFSETILFLDSHFLYFLVYSNWNFSPIWPIPDLNPVFLSPNIVSSIHDVHLTKIIVNPTLFVYPTQRPQIICSPLRDINCWSIDGENVSTVVNPCVALKWKWKSIGKINRRKKKR